MFASRLAESILIERARAQAVYIADGLRFAALQEALDQMRSPSVDGDVIGRFERVLTDRAESLLKWSADNLASEALALGRHDEAMLFREEIKECVYTALLDDNTCENCGNADGSVVEFGSLEYERLKPPYRECDGANRCRCQFVFTLRTEAPSALTPIASSNLRPRRFPNR